MRRLRLIRFALRELFLPLLIALAGVGWGTDLIVTGRLAAWHLPLIAGMLGTPLVAIGGSGPLDEPDEDEEEASQ